MPINRAANTLTTYQDKIESNPIYQGVTGVKGMPTSKNIPSVIINAAEGGTLPPLLQKELDIAEAVVPAVIEAEGQMLKGIDELIPSTSEFAGAPGFGVPVHSVSHKAPLADTLSASGPAKKQEAYRYY